MICARVSRSGEHDSLLFSFVLFSFSVEILLTLNFSYCRPKLVASIYTVKQVRRITMEKLFATWQKRCDAIAVRRFGMDTDGLPDASWWQYFDAGFTPSEAVTSACEEEWGC